MIKTKLTGKKKRMYNALLDQLGVVTAAAKQANIDRTTHYLWLSTDSVYKEEVSKISDICIEFAENALYKQIKNGNIKAIIFFLKTKGKHKGYIEKSELEVNTDINKIQIEFLQPDKRGDKDKKEITNTE